MEKHLSHPRVLILASRFDLTCDYVVACLRRRSASYLRLNSEDMHNAETHLNPVRGLLDVNLAGQRYRLTENSLHSVLYRRPVFLRDYGDNQRDPTSRFSQIQWAALFRSLMLFDKAVWINAPAATYKSEHKAVQLSVASKLGFEIPETRITNSPCADVLSDLIDNVAVKGVDTVLFRANGQESFGFTTFQRKQRLKPKIWRSAPATFQSAIGNKLDIRVTVVRGLAFAAEITANNAGVNGDWRTEKAVAEFTPHDLPASVGQLCVSLVRTLGLNFGAIDLVLSEGTYFFLEINPTGEWAWLVDAAGLPIDEAIADALIA